MIIKEMSVLPLKEEDFGLCFALDACVKCMICETQCPVMHATDLFAEPRYSGLQAERYRKDGQIVDSSIDYCSSYGIYMLVYLQGVKVTETIHHARIVTKKEEDIPPCNYLVGRVGFIGTVMTPVASIANWALDIKATRIAMEKVIGVHRNTLIPRSMSRTFESWFKKHTPLPDSGRGEQVTFLRGYAGQYFEVGTSIHSVQVLEHPGYEVPVPHRGCCDLALQSNGPCDESRKYMSRLTYDLCKANRNVPVVSVSDSCAGMLRHEANEILEVNAPELRDVGSRIWDICEFPMHLHDKGELDLNFQPMEITIPYHAPCQLKSQGLGLLVAELMELIPGATVKESNQPYYGTAGTCGMKKEKCDIARTVGKPVLDLIRQVNVKFAACDTETCRWQLHITTGANVIHPI